MIFTGYFLFPFMPFVPGFFFLPFLFGFDISMSFLGQCSGECAISVQTVFWTCLGLAPFFWGFQCACCSVDSFADLPRSEKVQEAVYRHS